jgi:hypothetical protein
MNERSFIVKFRSNSGERRLPACRSRQLAANLCCKHNSHAKICIRQAAECYRLAACAPQTNQVYFERWTLCVERWTFAW